MISLKENLAALLAVESTIKAMERMDKLISYYSERNKTAPAYVKFSNMANDPELHIDRDIMVQALTDQRQRMVEFLATLGIDANA